MIEFKRESEMELPVRNWLEEKGCIVHRQSTFINGSVPDLLGYALCSDSFYVVELKMSRYTNALMQAKSYRYYCHYSFIAFPSKRAENIYRKHQPALSKVGIGLLAVDPGSVSCVLTAGYNNNAKCEKLYRRFKREIRAMKEIPRLKRN